jgi:hypothetical protein
LWCERFELFLQHATKGAITMKVITIGIALAVTGFSASAQEIFVYPAKGQTAEQTEKDKFECYQWAKQQTGFDPTQPVSAAPTQPAPAAPPPASSPGGERVKGAARGAAVGAVVGEIANDDAGKGAAAGAAAGTMVGGMKHRDAKRAQQASEQKPPDPAQSPVTDPKRDAYNRAYKACLEGKGYTAK